ncbi:META domain-containing protein [Nocardia sp. ET3-3]|uniref:META domain-containing protein n=1 Tax=Nocardia terrae TaxID=2675851 RepID=A0A7K1USZ5_9NOCA|nr:META domain-containing protein [Nocardia terrae]MVU77269.1 META domain-containing protein [Nocardia terrae]
MRKDDSMEPTAAVQAVTAAEFESVVTADRGIIVVSFAVDNAAFEEHNASLEWFAVTQSRRVGTVSVDAPANGPLVERFCITTLPTLLIFQAGALVLTWAAPRNLDALPAVIDRLEAEPDTPIPLPEQPVAAAHTIAVPDPVSLNIDHGSAASLAHMAPDALDHLLLFDTPVTAADIEHLTGLTLLVLMNTGIDDNSIQRLAALTRLRQLEIADRTGPEDPPEPESTALAALRAALPHTVINGLRGRSDLIAVIRPRDTRPPMGHSYISTEVTGIPIPGGGPLILTFQDGRLSANSGCNTATGPVDLQGNRLRVGTMVHTAKGCLGDRGRADAWQGGLLHSRPTWTLVGDTLTVRGNGSTITLLDRKAARPDEP